MRVIPFLRREMESGDHRHEFRLACSGCVFNGEVVTFDWRKSTACRVLSDGLIDLVIASAPADSYPQELRLRFTTGMVSETRGFVTAIGDFADEIASDVAALLTIFLERFVAVAAHVGTIVQPSKQQWFREVLHDWPHPILNARPPVRERLPLSLVIGAEGTRVEDPNPGPVPVNPMDLLRFLELVPMVSKPEALIRAARLYCVALELANDRPDISYLLLVSAADAMAKEVFADYVPAREEILASRQRLVGSVADMGLTRENAEEVVLACSIPNNPWSRQKFSLFFETYVPSTFWSQERNAGDFAPAADTVLRTLSRIWQARSGLVHAGKLFAPTIRSRGGWVPTEVLGLGEKEWLPSLGWLIDCVRAALFGYVTRPAPTPTGPS